MNKQELLNLINSLPDDMFVMPIEMTESSSEHEPWEPFSERREHLMSGMYEKNINHILTLRLQFTTRQSGKFHRTDENPDGLFSNIRRVK